MAYDGEKKIDDASMQSNEAETALRAVFSQINGFVCREQKPDFGVDFQVELVADKRYARNAHFAIQLKSVAKLPTIDGGKMISFPFETRDLKYLTRVPPNLGMVVIYDAESKRCFYEFVSAITKALYSERDNSNWENKDSVNIHISVANVLDEARVKTLHSQLERSFINFTRMYDSYGEMYGLAKTSNRYADDDYDLNSRDGVTAFLMKNGTELLIEYQLGWVSILLSKLTDQDITKHTSILCLAAAARAEAGRFSESHIYCKKALRRSDLTADQKILICFADLKNRFKLGEITLEESIEELDAMQGDDLSPQSRLTLEANRIHARLSVHELGKNAPEEYRNQIRNLFRDIALSEVSPRVKLLLNTWNADNFSLFINLSFYGAVVSEPDRTRPSFAAAMMRITEHDRELLGYLPTIAKQAAGESGKLIRAYTLQVDVKHRVGRSIYTGLLKPDSNAYLGFKQNLQETIDLALTAFNYFSEEGIGYEAYLALCNVLELLEIGKFKLAQVMYDDVDLLVRLKKELEDEMLIEPHQMQVPGIFEKAGQKPV